MKFTDIMKSSIKWTSDHIPSLETKLNKEFDDNVFTIKSDNWSASYNVYLHDNPIARISDTGTIYHNMVQRIDKILYGFQNKRDKFINDRAYTYTERLTFAAKTKPVYVQAEIAIKDGYIHTASRELIVSKGDYIIHDNNGGIYSMKPDKFKKLYDILED